jgi:hypothetical protein
MTYVYIIQLRSSSLARGPPAIAPTRHPRPRRWSRGTLASPSRRRFLQTTTGLSSSPKRVSRKTRLTWPRSSWVSRVFRLPKMRGTQVDFGRHDSGVRGHQGRAPDGFHHQGPDARSAHRRALLSLVGLPIRGARLSVNERGEQRPNGSAVIWFGQRYPGYVDLGTPSPNPRSLSPGQHPAVPEKRPSPLRDSASSRNAGRRRISN